MCVLHWEGEKAKEALGLPLTPTRCEDSLSKVAVNTKIRKEEKNTQGIGVSVLLMIYHVPERETDAKRIVLPISNIGRYTNRTTLILQTHEGARAQVKVCLGHVQHPV